MYTQTNAEIQLELKAVSLIKMADSYSEMASKTPDSAAKNYFERESSRLLDEAGKVAIQRQNILERRQQPQKLPAEQYDLLTTNFLT